MKKTFFTVIIVSYNPGEKLFLTLESVLGQSFKDYRILIKDGMSTDGTMERLKKEYDLAIAQSGEEKTITLLESCDNGIYHAMNIATSYLGGKIFDSRAGKDKSSDNDVKLLKAGEEPSYVFFLNCGDYFYDKDVLMNLHRKITSRNENHGTTLPTIYYGDIYDSITKQRVASNPEINDFACYRNVPSHQACFYDERLIYKNPFNLKYKVRADYEQFLRCFYVEKAETCYIPIVISKYEGGGFSDQNKDISEKERKEIIKMYLPAGKIRKYDFLRIITLSGLRTFLASNKVTAGVYNGIKTCIYEIKGGSKKEK
ncbi:glycosyltransferase [Butyrivibrio sp. YAB3001]|uniref:glycosyltransferase n=1 Tax=Butyrivibrio sp. YAB3001 TaxID=1520812 RepID=UPI0008F61DE1|nr:glycosyltransferase [Butyrivibrio sp. YAB3001]SFC17351.1 Glycosyltransferase involved in cell wall bisynthesis [Butyrivibrio sp. YAB3001]